MQIFDTPGEVALQIRIPSGRVGSTTADEPRTSVELVSKRGRGAEAHEDIIIRADERDGRHVITVEQRDKIRWGPIQINWGGDARGADHVPARLGSRPRRRLHRPRRRGRARRGLREERLGRHQARDVRKKLEVKTASGDIWVGTMPEGGTTVTGMSGDLETPSTVPAGPAHRALGLRRRGESASIEAGELTLQTVSGDARIGVARGTRVWIDATSVSGDLELRARSRGQPARGGRGRRRKRRGRPAARQDGQRRREHRPRGRSAVASCLDRRAHELDHVVLAAFEPDLVHALLAAGARAAPSGRCTAGPRRDRLPRCPDDPLDPVARGVPVELPGGVEPLGRARARGWRSARRLVASRR